MMDHWNIKLCLTICFSYSILQYPMFLNPLGWPTSYYCLLCWVRNTTIRLITHCLGQVYGLVYKVQEFGGLHNHSSTGQWYSRYRWRGCGKIATKANICFSQNKQWNFSTDYSWKFYWVMNVVPSYSKHTNLVSYMSGGWLEHIRIGMPLPLFNKVLGPLSIALFR